MNAAFIAGVGMTPLRKHLYRSVKQLSAEAIGQALHDAGLDHFTVAGRQALAFAERGLL